MTSLWRYTAVEIRSPSVRKQGELGGATAADVRASLRRIGLQVIELKPIRTKRVASETEGDGAWNSVIAMANRHLRSRRRAQCAEFYDSLSTMLSAGLPLLEAVETLIESRRKARRGYAGSMLSSVRESLRSGESLGQAMCEHPGWFDLTDIAIVEAGQHSGTLPGVLASMAERQEKANELGSKLIGALAYPFLVLLVGMGVVVFLSIKTLPELVKILEGAKIPAPQLTLRVMWVGQLFANYWMGLLGVIALLSLAGIVLPNLLDRSRVSLPRRMRSFLDHVRERGPQVLRTLAVGGLAMRLAELVRSGVPMVDALRVIAPTSSNRKLRQALLNAANRIERGDELSAALDDERWFDAEFRRLLEIGQTTGELDSMLDRIGQRYERQARRQIDRLATLLEPCVILALAVLVGVVVMSAILPLLRLQEIL